MHFGLILLREFGVGQSLHLIFITTPPDLSICMIIDEQSSFIPKVNECFSCWWDELWLGDMMVIWIYDYPIFNENDLLLLVKFTTQLRVFEPNDIGTSLSITYEMLGLHTSKLKKNKKTSECSAIDCMFDFFSARVDISFWFSVQPYRQLTVRVGFRFRVACRSFFKSCYSGCGYPCAMFTKRCQKSWSKVRYTFEIAL